MADVEKRELSVEVADDIRAALDANPVARRAFEKMPPSHRREYVTWIEEAKKPETRARRIEKMVGEMEEKAGRLSGQTEPPTRLSP
jgi:uncharacterized protein YdeI (YjbR/CyaY-like superfamily)